MGIETASICAHCRRTLGEFPRVAWELKLAKFGSRQDNVSEFPRVAWELKPYQMPRKATIPPGEFPRVAWELKL